MNLKLRTFGAFKNFGTLSLKVLLNAALMLVLGVGNVWGQLFTQNFSSTSIVSDYVNSTSPNNGQFNAIGSSGSGTVVSITSGKLRFARTGNAGSFSRTTDFSGPPTSLIYKFDIQISANSVAQTSAAVFQVGSGFGTANSAEANANVHSRIGINTTSTSGQFTLRDIGASTNSGNLSGSQSIMWVINNSGGPLTYKAPDGTYETVADDKYDLWAGTTLLFNDANAQTTTQSLADLKFVFSQGSATIEIDNIVIDPIPSPPTMPTFSSVTASGFTLNWSTVTGATGYRLDIAETSDFSSLVSGYNDLAVAGTSLAVTGLASSTTYYARVRTENYAGTSNHSASGTQATSGSNPTITLINNTQITAGNANQNENNHLLSRFSVNVATASATLNSLTFTAGGDFTAGDISNFDLFTSATNTFPGGSPLATVSAAAIANGGTVTFSGLNQACAVGDRYFWITADVSGSAGVGRTVSVPSLGASNFTFASGTPTGTIDAGGTQTFISTVSEIALSSPASATADITQGLTNQNIYRFDLAVTVVNATLNGLTINTSGTYLAADLTNLKAWYSADATFDAGSDVLLSTKTTGLGAGSQVFPSFSSQVINSGSTGYIFITADLPFTATAGNTIAVDAITTTDISFVSGNKSGSANASGTKTIIACTPTNATALNLTSGNAQIAVSWTNPACFDELLIVAKPSSTIGASPSGDGSAYTANLAFGSGGASAFDGTGFVVYKGSTSPQTITGLTNGTSYFVRVFTRRGSVWSAGAESSATPNLINTATTLWNGGSNAWLTVGNWGSGLPSSTLVARFGSATQSTVGFNMNGASVAQRTVSAIEFVPGAIARTINNGSGSVSNTFIMSGAIINGKENVILRNNSTALMTIADGSSQTLGLVLNNPLNNIIDIDSSGGITISCAISGSNPLTLSGIGTGILTLTGANSYTSNTTISAGTLRLNRNGGTTLPATNSIIVSGGTLRISSNQTLNDISIASGATLTIDADVILTVNGVLQLNGTLNNAGTLNIGNRNITLNGTVTGNGVIQANGANLFIFSSGALGTLYFDQTTDGTTNSLATLIINRTNSGTVNLGNKLNVTGNVTLTDGVLSSNGNLTLKSTSAASTARIHGGTNASITGNVNFERFLPWAGAGNNGFRFATHSLRTAPVINTISGLPVATNTLILFNETNNSYEGISNRAGTWPLAAGYGVWTNAANTLTYTGEPQLNSVGPISLPRANAGWHYLGNPFPSVLDWEAVTRTQVDNAIYIWEKDNTGEGNGVWGSYVNGVTANNGSQYVAPGQGFAVRSQVGSPEITFPAAARSTAANPAYYRLSNQADVLRVRVTKASNQFSLETVIRFRDLASSNFDPSYDALFVSDFSNNSPDLYTTDGQGNKYSINSLSPLGTQPVLVPLQLETFGAGNYSFTFNSSAMISGASIQLEDTKTGSFTPIANGDVINFIAGANDATGRFRLHFNGLATSVAANSLDQVQVYTFEGKLYIRGMEQAEELRIVDMTGRVVYQNSAVVLTAEGVQPQLAAGTYLVQLVGKQGVKTAKVQF